MLKNLFKKTTGILLAMIMILSVFTVSPVFASAETGNVVLDVTDGGINTANNLPAGWVRFAGPESAIMYQNSMLTMSNEATTEQIAVNVHSINSDGVRGDGRNLFDNALIEFKVRKNSYEDASFNILSGSGRTTVGSVVFGENGDVSVLSRNKETTGSVNARYTLENAYSLNEFFSVKIFIKPTERLFSVWINDKLVIDNVVFRGSPTYTYVPLFRFEIPASEAENNLKLDIADFFIRNTVTQAALDDATALTAAAELITYNDILNGNSSINNILTDVSLPTSVAVVNPIPDTDGNVQNDVLIEWASSDASVIDPITGKVDIDADNKGKSITLTATFKKGEATAITKAFTAIVRGKDAQVVNGNFVKQVFDDLNTGALPSNWILESGDESAASLKNGMVTVSNEASADEVKVGFNLVNIIGAHKASAPLFDNAVFEFKARKNSYEDVYFDLCGGSNRNTMARIVFGANGTVTVNNCRTVENGPLRNTIYSLENAYSINEFFTVKVLASPGSGRVSVWVDDKLVIDGVYFASNSIRALQIARVVIPQRTGTNTVTFEIADLFIRNRNMQSALNDTQAVAAAKELITYRDLFGKNDHRSEIKSSLTLPVSVAVRNPIPYSDGTTADDVKITWASNNEAVINPATGVVTRPSGTGDANVKLTATISRGEALTTAEFDFVVKEVQNIATQSEYAVTDNQAVSAKIGIIFKKDEFTQKGISFNIGGNNKVDFQYLNDGSFSYIDENGETVTKSVFTDDTLYKARNELEIIVYPDSTAALLINNEVVFESIPVTNPSSESGVATFAFTPDESLPDELAEFDSLDVSEKTLYQISEDNVTVTNGSVSVDTAGFYATCGTDIYVAVYSNDEIKELLNVSSFEFQQNRSALNASLEKAGTEGTLVKVFVWNNNKPMALPVIK